MTGLILCRRWKSASLGNLVEKEKCRVKEVRLGRGNLLSPSTLTRVYLCLGKPDTWAMQSFAGSQATITLDDDDDDSQDEKDLQECPVCFQKFPTKEIEKHARKCLDKWVQRIPYWFGWVNCRRRRENCLTNRQILLSQFTCHALKRLFTAINASNGLSSKDDSSAYRFRFAMVKRYLFSSYIATQNLS